MRANDHIQLYPILRVAIFLSAGIIIGDTLYDAVPLTCWLVLGVCSVLVSLLLRGRCVSQSLMIFVSFMLLGCCISVMRRDKTNVALPSGEVEYDAVIITRPVAAGKVVRFDAIVTDMGRPFKVRASVWGDSYASLLSVGEGIRVRSVLRPPENFAGASFDYRMWLLRHGYSATTYIPPRSWRGCAVSLSVLSSVERARLVALRYRDKILWRYGELSFGGDEYAVAAAMTLGDKSSLPESLKEAYSISGASHVLALSGLHLGIIYTMLMLFFRGRRGRWIGVMPVVLAVWAYVFVVGMSVSVLRSAVMLTVYSFVSLLNRDRMSVNTLALAAVILLVANPMNIYDVGFQMSFMAVLFIFIFMRPVYSLMPSRYLVSSLTRWLWSLVAVSVSAQIGVAPLVAYYFGRFSCYFLLTNVIVVPLATLVLYAAVMLLPLAFWNTGQMFLASFLGRLVSALNGGVEWVASLRGACVDGIDLNLLQLFMLYVLIFAVYGIMIYLGKMNWERNEPLR